MSDLPRFKFPSDQEPEEIIITGSAQVPMCLKGSLISTAVFSDDDLFDGDGDTIPRYELKAYLTETGLLVFQKSELTWCDETEELIPGFQKYVLILTKHAAHRFFTVRVDKHLTSPSCYIDWLKIVSKKINDGEPNTFFFSIDDLMNEGA